MNEEDKTKIRTAVTVLLMQNPKGLTANELSHRIITLHEAVDWIHKHQYPKKKETQNRHNHILSRTIELGG